MQYYGTFQESNIYSYTTDIVKKAILPQKARHLDMSGVLEVLLSCVLQHMDLESLCGALSRGPQLPHTLLTEEQSSSLWEDRVLLLSMQL